MDRVEQDLNNYMKRNEEIERSFETLIESHELSFNAITEEINYLMDLAKDYDGFDFTEELSEYIKGEILC
jgi:hypothetical protein